MAETSQCVAQLRYKSGAGGRSQVADRSLLFLRQRHHLLYRRLSLRDGDWSAGTGLHASAFDTRRGLSHSRRRFEEFVVLSIDESLLLLDELVVSSVLLPVLNTCLALHKPGFVGVVVEHLKLRDTAVDQVGSVPVHAIFAVALLTPAATVDQSSRLGYLLLTVEALVL